MGRVEAFREYDDNFLIGDSGRIVKLRRNDQRISRAITVGQAVSNGTQLDITDFEQKQAVER